MTDDQGWKGRPPENPSPMGAVVERFKSIENRLDSLETSAPLQSAMISAGGLVVQDGGGVTVKDGGGLEILDGGDVTVDGGGMRILSAGKVTVEDGGSFEVLDGGALRGRYPDGVTSAMIGPLRSTTGGPDGHGLLVQGPASTGNTDIFRAKWTVEGDKRVIIGSTGNPVDSVSFRSNSYWIRCESATGTGDDAPFRLSCAGEIGIYSNTGRLRVPWVNASATANVALDADGIIQRVSSARKYKQDIEDYRADPDAVLALRPRTWRDRGEVERNPDTTTRYPGFIAEEVHDLGLTDLVVYDADGNPDALNYDRFPAALLAVMQRQQHQIDTLTTELAALRAAITPTEEA